MKQPWAWAIVEAGKWIENRSWEPPDALLGEVFAIHAGLKKPSTELVEEALECASEDGRRIAPPDQFQLGCIIGVATLDGYVTDHDEDDFNECVMAHGDAHEATAMMSRAIQSPWFFGPVGFVLTDVRRLVEPVPCKGALGFWELASDVERLVRAQLPSRRSRAKAKP
jgi:hypothetical protein